MWGWLGSIFSSISSLNEKISNISATIKNSVSSLFDNVVSAITSVKTALGNLKDDIIDTITSHFNNAVSAISSLPNTIYENFKQKLIDLRNRLDKILTFFTSTEEGTVSIFNILKDIFVPDAEDLKESLLTAVDSISHTFNLGIDTSTWLVDAWTEEAIPDAEGKYYIPGVGEFNFVFFDTRFLRRGIEFFRPIIRGFIVLLLVFYNFREIMSFINQDPGMYSSAKDTYMQDQAVREAVKNFKPINRH